MIIERGPADALCWLGRGLVQFVIGSMPEGEQRIVGIQHSLHDLVQLALCRSLLASLRVLDDEHHGQGQRRYQVWKMASQRPGNPAAMLTMIHAPVAAMISTAARGREACRSTLATRRLMTDLVRRPEAPGPRRNPVTMCLRPCGPPC